VLTHIGPHEVARGQCRACWQRAPAWNVDDRLLAITNHGMENIIFLEAAPSYVLQKYSPMIGETSLSGVICGQALGRE